MIRLYAVAVALHVLVAVLGVGLVGAIPITARIARRYTAAMSGAGQAGQTGAVEAMLAILLLATQLAFLLMVITGVLLDVSMAGAFHRTAWFQVSIAVLLVVGLSHARARSALRNARREGARDAALGRVERWGIVMCVGVATVALLMQVKP
jgi:hypothetical protein